jgi:Tfp pilus assembly protein PilO
MTDVRRVLKENRRAVSFIAVALVVNAALYVLVVYPLSRRVQAEQQQSGDATRQRTEASRAHAAAIGTVTGKKQANEELQKFYSDVLPSGMSAARQVLTPHVVQLARSADLTVFRAQLGQETDGNDSGLRKLTITITLAGEYANIRRFVHDLETAPEFLVLESVTLTQASEGEAMLNVSAKVATYFRAAANGN